MLGWCANISMLFPEASLLERIGLAKSAGFSAVEIQFPYSEKAEEIAEQLVLHQMPLALINCPAGDLLSGGEGLACINEHIDQQASALSLCYEYAAILLPKFVNVLSGAPTPNRSFDVCLNTFITNLQLANEKFGALNSQIVTEIINPTDVPNFFLSSFKRWDQVSVAVPFLTLQFDCYHMSRLQEPVLDRFREYRNQIAHMQFADDILTDINGDLRNRRGEPGSGDMDYKTIFQTLTTEFDGYLSAEYIPSQAGTNSLAWLDQF